MPRSRGSVPVVPTLPPRVPRVPPNPALRWFARGVLRLAGWRVIGTVPDISKLVLIGAPHSTNWDGIWGFAAKAAMGLDIRILGKDTLFRVPVVGWLLRHFGVIPVNRRAASGVVEQTARMFGAADSLWIGLAPEGTRKPVEQWKAGFWKIAHAARVPVLPVYFHYPDKVIGFGAPFELGDDMAADMRRIRDWYRPWQGKYHGTD